MLKLHRITANLGMAAILAMPLTLVTATPASAAEVEFSVGGAEVDFEVEKENGRFEIEVDIDEARPGSEWRVKLWHDGHRYHNRIHTANRFGEIEIDEDRRDSTGDDVFKIKVRKVGTDKVEVRRIRLR